MIDVTDFNHVSNTLSSDQIDELKSYYKTYHKKMWIYKKAYKSYRKWKLIGNISSAIIAAGGISSSIPTSGISLVAATAVSLFIQIYLKHKNLDIKTYQCHYAFQRYGHLLISIKEILRSGEFDDDLLKKLQHADYYILDNTPIVDKQARMYDKLFH